VNALPVDVEAIAVERGLEVENLPDFPPNCYGALARRPDSNAYSVLVSDQCPSNGHRRFTIGHEVGHFILEGHVDALLGGANPIAFSPIGLSRKKDWFEIEADSFSAELLLPSRLVASVVRGFDEPDVTSVRSLASTAEASLSAAAIAFARNSDLPFAAFVCHERSIEWMAISPPLAEHRWASAWAMKGEWAPLGSATYRLSKAPERIRASETEEGGGWLTEWFDDAPHLEMVETAKGLGDYGRVLTTIWVPDLDAIETDEDDAW